ncbi:hypothetical protein D3C80_976920 [compost metagenome]
MVHRLGRQQARPPARGRNRIEVAQIGVASRLPARAHDQHALGLAVDARHRPGAPVAGGQLTPIAGLSVDGVDMGEAVRVGGPEQGVRLVVVGPEVAVEVDIGVGLVFGQQPGLAGRRLDAAHLQGAVAARGNAFEHRAAVGAPLIPGTAVVEDRLGRGGHGDAPPALDLEEDALGGRNLGIAGQGVEVIQDARRAAVLGRRLNQRQAPRLVSVDAVGGDVAGIRRPPDRGGRRGLRRALGRHVLQIDQGHGVGRGGAVLGQPSLGAVGRRDDDQVAVPHLGAPAAVGRDHALVRLGRRLDHAGCRVEAPVAAVEGELQRSGLGVELEPIELQIPAHQRLARRGGQELGQGGVIEQGTGLARGGVDPHIVAPLWRAALEPELGALADPLRADAEAEDQRVDVLGQHRLGAGVDGGRHGDRTGGRGGLGAGDGGRREQRGDGERRGAAHQEHGQGG